MINFVATGLFVGCCMVAPVQASTLAPARDCTVLVSALERLACFDAAAGTPARVPVLPTRPAVLRPEIVALVEANEAGRESENHRFRLLQRPQIRGEGPQMVISAPALGATPPRPLLVISCQSNISRLQVLVAAPLVPNRVRLRLFKDGRPVADARDWRVLDSGQVIDAGRGLPAIEVLRELSGARRLRLQSDDYPPLNGLVFDAEGLDALIKQERELCRW